MRKLLDGNVLIIGDTHIPYERKDYLEFCKEIQNRVRCKTVIHIGDLCDNHSISYHEHDPDAMSPADEMKEADKHLVAWFKAFPIVKLCAANHDLVDRKGKTAGLPKRCFKMFPEIWNLPKSWDYQKEYSINSVTYTHGSGYSGETGHLKAAYRERNSTVIGHIHSAAGCGYTANNKDCIFGMNVGCGIDRDANVFDYTLMHTRKPVIGCGVVTDYGRFAQFFPMSLGRKK